ncbi:MAG: SRPBCC family protein [Bacteroidia bacterium]|jgi:carbon monoxide dehydrogenase subunit G
MLEIKTTPQQIAASSDIVFQFLADLNNLQNLMPDRVEGWQSDADKCTFTIKGMATIEMQVKERNPNSSIVLESFGKSPFPFTLSSSLVDKDGGTEVSLVFQGDMNPFMKMMAEGPLRNFFNQLAEKLPQQFL